ncbi:MAG: prepilin-type N-terminal cleavage/methylation domain-containing protein [Gemmatimonadales bacterium]|nr:MAG: prepilin-type N-terminal cleavage/methylation domain-containing protein [Gemmatimonadales bacterium]
MQNRIHNQRGFTIVEMLIVLSIISLAMLMANTSFITFRESSTVNRAARVIAADVALARSYAIRHRTSVALVANESTQSYVIRDNAGTVYLNRAFDARSEMLIGSLDVAVAGDSIAFNERGFMSGAGSANIDIARNGRRRRVQVNAVGRWRITVN